MERNSAQKALVIGCGSIGLRHADILKRKGFDVACVSRRKDLDILRFENAATALATFQPDVIVIATRTVEHWNNCQVLTQEGFSGLVLIEKPLCDTLPETVPLPPYTAFVAYNLRFHPVIQRIRALLRDRQIFSAQFSVGQYLPTWRPAQDYRSCYSAHAKEGGGVLRDLSHELDLALWLFGPWRSVTSRIGTWGKLEIDAEDTVDILGDFSQCPSVSLHLDYQNLFPHRTIRVQANGLSLWGDLVQGTLRANDSVETFVVERNDTYEHQWQDVLSSTPASVCTWQEGVEVMRFLEAVEQAARYQRWEINQ